MDDSSSGISILISWLRVSIHQRAFLPVIPATFVLLRASSRSKPVPLVRRSLLALLQVSPRAYGWCRIRRSCATLAATLKSKQGIAVRPR